MHAVRSDGFAGVERHVARLARAQAEQGDQVVVVGGDAAPMARTLGAAPVRLVPGATTRAVVLALLRFGPEADVVHVHMTAAEVAATVAATLLPLVGAGRRRLAPVVATRHFARPRGTGRLGPVVAAVARRRVSAQIAISTYVADAVDGPSVVVRPGFESASTTFPRSDERDPVVLVAQRLEPEKRTDAALCAFHASGLAAQGWRLDVAGDGSERGALVDLAEELDVGTSVRFLGRLDDVDALMGRASVMLAPCPVEGLGLSVLEAMANGLPVVAADAGGHVELLGGIDDVLLNPPLDAAAAGRALAVLAHAPGRRDAIAAAARSRQEDRFSPSAQAIATDRVYRAALGST
nr:glycosyltransferase family 4 protein [Cellulosimicrobium arenosum]